MVFSFQLTCDLFIEGIILALIIGFISGVLPALKADRITVIVAFQSAG